MKNKTEEPKKFHSFENYMDLWEELKKPGVTTTILDKVNEGHKLLSYDRIIKAPQLFCSYGMGLAYLYIKFDTFRNRLIVAINSIDDSAWVFHFSEKTSTLDKFNELVSEFDLERNTNPFDYFDTEQLQEWARKHGAYYDAN